MWRDLPPPVVPPPAGGPVRCRHGAPFAPRDQLYRSGLLRYPRILSAYAQYRGLDRRVHSGDYRIEQPISPVQLLQLLQSPSRALHWVTIPEGYTARQVAAVLEREGFGGRDVFRCAMRDPPSCSSATCGHGVEGLVPGH